MSFNIGQFRILNTMASSSLWQRFQRHCLYYQDLGFSLDIRPGVEAGKRAATRLLELQKEVRAKLTDGPGKTAEQIARSIEADPEDVFHVLRHLASNDPHIRVSHSNEPADDQFSYTEQNAAD